MNSPLPSLPRCPDRQQLLALAEGSLGEEVVELFVAHVDRCPQCESEYASLIARPDPLGQALQVNPHYDELLQEPELGRLIRRAKQCAPSVHIVGRTKTLPAREDFPARIGQYDLIEVLGHGGMGIVFRARDVELDCVVAVKLIRGSVNRSALERFKREKRALGQLNHANIVRARTAGVDDGVHFLAMDFVDGIDLSTLVRERGPLAVANACLLISQAARGLQYIHEQGQVHRDLKPSNLMLDADCTVKILDLGLAQLRQPAGERELTGRGVMGTLEYMAPEQLQNPHGVDIRADIYSLGVTLYKLLAGRTPYNASQRRAELDESILSNELSADDPKIRARSNHHPAADAPHPLDICAVRSDVPEPLARVILRAVALDPAQRHAVPRQLADALAPFCRGGRLEDLIGRVSPSAETPVPGAASTASSPRTAEDVPVRIKSVRPPVPWQRAAVWSVVPVCVVALLGGIIAFVPKGTAPSRNSLPAVAGTDRGNSSDTTGRDSRGADNPLITSADQWTEITGQGLTPIFETLPGDLHYRFDGPPRSGLQISCKETGMVACGELAQPLPERIALDLMRLNWRGGGVGMFLGYQPVESPSISARVQILEITKGQNELRQPSLQISRQLAVITKEQPPRLTRGAHGITWEVPWNLKDDWNRLELDFESGELTAIRFNEQACQRLYGADVRKHYSQETYQGLWGVFNGHGTSWFRMVEITYPKRSRT